MTRVLIIDDDEGIRDFLGEALIRKGFDVECATDGRRGIDALARTAFDVVLTDLKMPGPDGMEVLRYALSEQPGTQVVLLTAHGTVEVAVEAMKIGAFDFLVKPVSGLDELRLLVERAAERKRHLLQTEQRRLEDAALPPIGYGSPAMATVADQLARVAPTEATVLLTGESGTGKEIAARTVHASSRRCDGPFVAINCAAVTETLLESELFGHEKGAFTGATSARPGRIELATGGTLFLDEIGEMRPDLQAKLLRILQERTYERVGGSRTHTADIRWVAATNQDLGRGVADGSFRQDLYHRLAVVPIELPPLRQRREDILPLARRMLARYAGELAKPGLELTPEAERALEAAPWPGNVRELGNVLERAAILGDSRVIDVGDLRLAPGTPSNGQTPVEGTLEEIERAAIERALETEDGNRRRAAERLQIGLRTLYDKIKKYGL